MTPLDIDEVLLAVLSAVAGVWRYFSFSFWTWESKSIGSVNADSRYASRTAHGDIVFPFPSPMALSDSGDVTIGVPGIRGISLGGVGGLASSGIGDGFVDLEWTNWGLCGAGLRAAGGFVLVLSGADPLTCGRASSLRRLD